MTSTETPGQRLRRIRKAAGLSQLALATKAGDDRSAISNIERGEIGLGEVRAIRFAKALNVRPDDLLGSPAEEEAEIADDDIRLDDLLATLQARTKGVDAVVAEVLQLLTRRLRLVEQRRARATRRATGGIDG